MFSAGFQLLPLQIVSSFAFAFPYVIALLVLSIVVLVLLAKSSSFRKYRRKRNIIAYHVIVLVFVLLILQMDNVTRRALVDYSLGSPSDKFYAGQTNQINLNCANHGDRTASFSLILTSVNASFMVQNQQSYVQVDNRTVKVPFLLRENWFSENADSKPVLFVIDGNVTGFSFHISFEAQSSQLNVMGADTEITFRWNETGNYYVLYGKSGFVV